MLLSRKTRSVMIASIDAREAICALPDFNWIDCVKLRPGFAILKRSGQSVTPTFGCLCGFEWLSNNAPRHYTEHTIWGVSHRAFPGLDPYEKLRARSAAFAWNIVCLLMMADRMAAAGCCCFGCLPPMFDGPDVLLWYMEFGPRLWTRVREQTTQPLTIFRSIFNAIRIAVRSIIKCAYDIGFLAPIVRDHSLDPSHAAIARGGGGGGFLTHIWTHILEHMRAPYIYIYILMAKHLWSITDTFIIRA